MQKTIIDVSEHQGKINWAAVKQHIDGVIIRCGYGDDDKSQDDMYWLYNVRECERLGIPYGVYLYSYADTVEHIKSEIEHAKRLLKGHKPQYPVYIDLEEWAYGDIATKAADMFCKAIKAAGYVAGVYTYESFYNQFMRGYARYTLWIASYADPDVGKPTAKPSIGTIYDAWQFSSNYHVGGYSGRMDVSYFYKTWGASETPAKPATKAICRGQVAADIHKRMVQDERFGYSWEERYGAKPETWTVDGVTFKINVGDYDCSSSAITAWDKALTGTKYSGVLTKANTTHDMRRVFTGSGLFEWKPTSFIASPGDLYLSEENHVAICQRQTPDELSEFSWGDNGAYGNKRGDQSGFESRVNPYYDYKPDGWDGILHYNGKADTDAPTPSPEPTPKQQVAFRLSIDSKGKKWLSEGVKASGTKAIRWIAVKNAGRYRVCTMRNGWLPWVNAYDPGDLKNSCAGDGSKITGVEIENEDVAYAVRVRGRTWYPEMHGTHDTGGTGDNFAGDLMNAIDGFWCKAI